MLSALSATLFIIFPLYISNSTAEQSRLKTSDELTSVFHNSIPYQRMTAFDCQQHALVTLRDMAC